jgi:hypothetical protein
MLRLVIGRSLVAVGFASTLVAFCLIAKSGGGSPYMYVVWGLGLSAMAMGFNALQKKQSRESPFSGRSPGRPDDNSRALPATQEQKSVARKLGITFSPSISNGDLSDLITEEQAGEK